MTAYLRPRPSLLEVLRGRAPLLGPRAAPEGPTGWVSPLEPALLLGLVHGDLEQEEASLLGERPSAFGVLARFAVASVLGNAPSEDSETRWVVSAHVSGMSVAEALRVLCGQSRARKVYFVHAHALNLAAANAAYRGVLARGDLLLPDGIGIRLATRLLGRPLRQNLNGTDLLPLLVAEASVQNRQLALVGGRPGVAASCAAALRRQAPALSIGFVADGFSSESVAVEQLRKLGPVTVLVGLGSPLQEEWVERVAPLVPEATFVTVGGLFDFYSDRVRRAPKWLREMGLEWAYRLRQEPRRLAARYLLGNPAFLLLVALQAGGVLQPPSAPGARWSIPPASDEVSS